MKSLNPIVSQSGNAHGSLKHYLPRREHASSRNCITLITVRLRSGELRYDDYDELFCLVVDAYNRHLSGLIRTLMVFVSFSFRVCHLRHFVKCIVIPDPLRRRRSSRRKANHILQVYLLVHISQKSGLFRRPTSKFLQRLCASV